MNDDIEQQLAEMSIEDFRLVCASARPPEDLVTIDPQVAAAAALRRYIGANTVESIAQEFDDRRESSDSIRTRLHEGDDEGTPQ